MKYLIFLITFSVSAETTSHLKLPIERVDGTLIQCELAEVKAYINGDCTRYTVIDTDGLQSDFSTESCGGDSADLNMDGTVNAADLAIMKSRFFMAL